MFWWTWFILLWKIIALLRCILAFNSFIAIIWCLIIQFFVQVHSLDFVVDLHLYRNTGCYSHHYFLCADLSVCILCGCVVFIVFYLSFLYFFSMVNSWLCICIPPTDQLLPVSLLHQIVVWPISFLFCFVLFCHGLFWCFQICHWFSVSGRFSG